MSGMSGGSMLRTRRKDVNIKPNRRLDRKSSRGMLYENEELRLRTININAEVERGQSDIKKLKRENEQLRREVGALRGEYDRLEKLLKSRHLEDMSDHEVNIDSDSCCSDCESDCCNVQNDMNDMKNDLPTCCTANTITNVGYADSNDVKNEEDEGFDMLMSNLVQCGTLSVVPEEPSSRVTSPEPKDREDGMNAFVLSDESESNPKPEYYKAVVTLPLEAHEEPEMQSVSIFPKSSLDVLMNNNTYEDYQSFRSSPSIGFIIPQQTKNNCKIISANHNYQVLSDQNDQDLDGGSIEDFLKYVDPIIRNSNRESKKDAYIICNTRKIIQQLTLHSPIQNDPNPTIIIPSDAPNQTSYKTEKNIDLDYDYPQPFRSEQRINLEPVGFDIRNDVSHATQTTTEIKNTFLMFERNSSRMKRFMRSQSEPVEILTEEPVYATVNKLPKKLKRLHINNLENEIKYIPSEEAIDIKETVTKPPKLTIQIPSILKNSDIDTLEDSNINEPDVESKFESHATNNIIPKSPVEIKKKRFSIHFKRKANKKVTPPKTSEEAEVKVDPILSNSKSDSDRLLEQSSSLDSGDVESSVKLKENGCKKHRHLKQTHIPNRCRYCPNCDCHKVHHCEKCSSKKSSVKDNDHGKTRNSVPGFKIPYDSYQEMTTSHSERERTNSLSSSGHSGLSLNIGKPRVNREDSIPWCGCWGNSCL